MDYGDTHNAIT